MGGMEWKLLSVFGYRFSASLGMFLRPEAGRELKTENR
jgi:hypothetical protein